MAVSLSIAVEGVDRFYLDIAKRARAKVSSAVFSIPEKVKVATNKKAEEIRNEIAMFEVNSANIEIQLLLNEFGTDSYKAKLRKDGEALQVIFDYKVGVALREYFDIFRWWAREGKNTYPNLFLLAMIVLNKPAHNGFQERVFLLELLKTVS